MADESGEPRERDLLTRLADAGEEAIRRLSDVPGTGRIADSLTSMRTRVDDLQRRVSGLGELERRLDRLEQRVDELSAKTSTKRASAQTSKRSTSSPSKPGAKDAAT